MKISFPLAVLAFALTAGCVTRSGKKSAAAEILNENCDRLFDRNMACMPDMKTPTPKYVR